jgi:hypothetical protein
MPAHIEFCDEEAYGADWWGWYVVFPDGDAIGPLADKDEALGILADL